MLAALEHGLASLPAALERLMGRAVLAPLLLQRSRGRCSLHQILPGLLTSCGRVATVVF